MTASYAPAAPAAPPVAVLRLAGPATSKSTSARSPADDVLWAIDVLREFGAEPADALGEREADALGVLYRRHAGALLQLALRLTGNSYDAQDVVHDVFVGLPRALQQYRHGNFDGWLRCVTSRVALMGMRKRNRRREESYSAADDSAGWADTRPDDFEAIEDTAAVRRAMGRLSEPLRQVVALRVYAELSHQQIAELLDITPNVSQVRFCRAIKRLRTLLAWSPSMSAAA